MNLFVGTGNFVRDPELREVANGIKVAHFTLVFNTRHRSASGKITEEACFIDCEAWDSGGETIYKYFKKGDPIIITESRLRRPSWVNQNGEKRSKVQLRIGQFEFPLSRKPVRKPEEVEPASQVDGTQESGSNDIPF